MESKVKRKEELKAIETYEKAVELAYGNYFFALNLARETYNKRLKEIEKEV